MNSERIKEIPRPWMWGLLRRRQAVMTEVPSVSSQNGTQVRRTRRCSACKKRMRLVGSTQMGQSVRPRPGQAHTQERKRKDRQREACLRLVVRVVLVVHTPPGAVDSGKKSLWDKQRTQLHPKRLLLGSMLCKAEPALRSGPVRCALLPLRALLCALVPHNERCRRRHRASILGTLQLVLLVWCLGGKMRRYTRRWGIPCGLGECSARQGDREWLRMPGPGREGRRVPATRRAW